MFCKNNIPSLLRLYAVTDRRWITSTENPAKEQTLFLQAVEQAIRGGCTCLQLREKHLDTKSFIAEAAAVHNITKHYGVPLIINDNVEAAAAVKAEGIHLGLSDMNAREARRILGKDVLIGVSVHNTAEAENAAAAGADIIGVGAVFATGTKNDVDILLPDIIQDICKVSSLPAVGIGGITGENMHLLAGSGLCGAAVVSALFASADIYSAAVSLRNEADKIFGGSIQ